VLARIQDSFHTMIRSRTQGGLASIEITCFFEELPLSGIGVVSQVPNFCRSYTNMFLSDRSIRFGYPTWLYSDRDTEQSHEHDKV